MMHIMVTTDPSWLKRRCALEGLAVLAMLLCALASCGPRATLDEVSVAAVDGTAHESREEATMTVDETDVDLQIVDYRRVGSGWRLVARGTRDGVQIGLAVVLEGGWKIHTYSPVEGLQITNEYGHVRYERVGSESDRLVETLARLYGVKVLSPRMMDSVTFNAGTLKGEIARFEDEPLWLKLVAPDGNGTAIYTNIDVPAGTLTLREKDPDFRNQLIARLSAPSH